MEIQVHMKKYCGKNTRDLITEVFTEINRLEIEIYTFLHCV